jgi:hypothetical protein
MTSIEAGCPRTYVESSTDEPGMVDPREVTQSVKEFRAMPTYGPFIEMLADGRYGVGSTFSAKETGGRFDLSFTIQSASWIHLKRVELYENGRLIQAFAIDPDKSDVLKLSQTVTLTPKKDSWYVLVAMGDQDLSPVFQTVELPYIELDAIIEDALRALNNENCAGLFGAPLVFPNKYPVFPYGFTNPIWVDVDGDKDGDGKIWEAPGHADYMRLDSRAVVPPTPPEDAKSSSSAQKAANDGSSAANDGSSAAKRCPATQGTSRGAYGMTPATGAPAARLRLGPGLHR